MDEKKINGGFHPFNEMSKLKINIHEIWSINDKLTIQNSFFYS